MVTFLVWFIKHTNLYLYINLAHGSSLGWCTYTMNKAMDHTLHGPGYMIPCIWNYSKFVAEIFLDVSEIFFWFSDKPVRGQDDGPLTSGDGSPMGALPSNVLLSNLSPRMVLRWWAMSLCCSMPQWFSTDRITGYSDTWRFRQAGQKIGGNEWVCNLILE